MWKVRLLGGLRVTDDANTVVRFRSRPVESIFAYLAIHAGQDIRRDVLIEIGWPNTPPGAGMQSLRVGLTSLRQTFGPKAIIADRQKVRLEPGVFSVDVLNFQELSDPDGYGGRLLEGSDFEWAHELASTLEDMYFRSVIEAMERGNPTEAIRLGTVALQKDPSHLGIRSKMRELGQSASAPMGPMQANEFVGRTTEINDLMTLLRTARLVTIVGPGGSGKTRLAGELWRLSQPHAWFVPLEELQDSCHLAEHMRITLRLPDSPTRTASDQVVFCLADTPGLLVLDNFEHLVSSAGVVEQLLTGSPQVRILVTSQVPLGLSQEVVYPLGPLSTLPNEPGGVSDSMLLLTSRLATANPRLKLDAEAREAAAQIARRLDGFPLAIELAASRGRIMAPQEILHQLDHPFEFLDQQSIKRGKHQSLLNTLDWSFDRLPEAAQGLATELSVFPGSFDVQAVQAVCGQRDSVGLLESLVAHGWLVPEILGSQFRFRLLQPIRHYGADLLAPRRAATLRKALADHFLTRVTSMHKGIFRAGEPEIHRQMLLEAANLDAAWEWFDQHDRPKALALICYQNWFSLLTGRSRIARGRLVRVMDESNWVEHDLKGLSRLCMGNFCNYTGDQGGAEQWYAEAVRVSHPAEANRGIALMQWSQVHTDQGEYLLAHEDLRQSRLALADDPNPNWLLAVDSLTAYLLNREGNFLGGKQSAQAAVEGFRATGYPWGICCALNELAMSQHFLGEWEASVESQEESIAIKRAEGYLQFLGNSLTDLAATKLALSQTSEAAAALRESVHIWMQLGVAPPTRALITGARLMNDGGCSATALHALCGGPRHAIYEADQLPQPLGDADLDRAVSLLLDL